MAKSLCSGLVKKSPLVPLRKGVLPHPTSLRSATFPHTEEGPAGRSKRRLSQDIFDDGDCIGDVLVC